MAAHEQQNKCVVFAGVRLGILGQRQSFRFFRYNLFAMPPRHLASNVIGHSPRSHLDQPSARIGGNSISWPLRGSSDQCFLYRVLRCRKVAESSHNRT